MNEILLKVAQTQDVRHGFPLTDRIAALEAENAKIKAAIKRITDECTKHIPWRGGKVLCTTCSKLLKLLADVRTREERKS